MSDCSKTYNYFAEKNRMTKSTCERRCNISCHECPLSRFNNGEKISCRDFEMLHTKHAIFLVQVWSAEHPPKKHTCQNFFNIIQMLNLMKMEHQKICPHNLGLNDIESCEPGERHCAECWNQVIN